FDAFFSPFRANEQEPQAFLDAQSVPRFPAIPAFLALEEFQGTAQKRFRFLMTAHVTEGRSQVSQGFCRCWVFRAEDSFPGGQDFPAQRKRFFVSAEHGAAVRHGRQRLQRCRMLGTEEFFPQLVSHLVVSVRLGWLSQDGVAMAEGQTQSRLCASLATEG